MTSLCAICANDGAICANDGEGAMQTLDRREVFVCTRCDSEHPRQGGYSFDDADRCADPGNAHMGTGLGPGCRVVRGRGTKAHGS